MAKTIKMAVKKVGKKTTTIKSGARGNSKRGTKNPLRTSRSVVKQRKAY